MFVLVGGIFLGEVLIVSFAKQQNAALTIARTAYGGR